MHFWLTLFLIFFLASCSSIDKNNRPAPVIKGLSAGYVLIPIEEDIDSGYIITKNNEKFLVYGLPYVYEDTSINLADRTLLVEYFDFGESRIEINVDSLVNPSLEDRERASAEFLEVKKIVSNISPQLNEEFIFIPPINTLITSPFGKRRFINNNPRSPHMGLDIRGSVGTPIVAPKDGIVVLADNHFYSGNIVILDHGGGLFTSYSHLDSYDVEVNSKVLQGQVFASAGSTGRVTGPHLHWVVYLNGNRINPETLIELERL